MKIFLSIISFLFRREMIALQDFDGDVSYSLVYNTPFGRMAKRHWPFNVRNVILNDNGTVANGSYVKLWKAMK